MTDPAPPARTTLTPEGVFPRGMLDFMEALCPSALAHGNAEGTWRADCAPCFADLIRAAFAEGRLAGLEEAASLAEIVPTQQRLDVAEAIRLLAADRPKALKDQADPADPELR